MTQAPELIWATGQNAQPSGRWWHETELKNGVEYIRADLAPQWQPIETAPKDCDILVWYDHDADPYRDPSDENVLTDYAAWTEGGDFLDGKGFAIAKWQPQFWETVDEYGAGYFMPAAWFALEFGDYQRVCNPIWWMPLPAPPK